MGCPTGIDIIELRLPCLRLSGHSSILSGYFHFRNNHFFVWLTFLTNMMADNLLNREFEQHGPCKVLLTDITYIPYHGVSLDSQTLVHSNQDCHYTSLRFIQILNVPQVQVLG